MAKIGSIIIDLVAHTGELLKPLKKAQAAVGDFAGKVSAKMKDIASSFGSAALAVAGLGGALSAAGIVGRSLQMATNLENAQIAFTTFLKSGTKATKMLNDLKKFSDVTPFEANEIRDAGKQLLAYGFEADKITDYLQVMGDAAAGSQKPIADFVDILGKMRGAGVASLGDINRLSDRGIMVTRELSKQWGMTELQVKGLISTGKVGFDDVWQVMKNVTGEAGLYGGAMESLSKSTMGKLSTFKSKMDDMFAGIGTAILEGLDLKGLADTAINLAETYKEDIVDATVKALEMMKTLLEKGPAWIAEIRTLMLDASDLAKKGYAAYEIPFTSYDDYVKKVARIEHERRLSDARFSGAAGLSKPIFAQRSLAPGGKAHGILNMPLSQLFGTGGARLPARSDIITDARVKSTLQGVWKAMTFSPAQMFGKDMLAGGGRMALNLAQSAGAVAMENFPKEFKAFQGSVGAVERGSQAAFSAIVGTMKKPVEEQQLAEAKKHTRMWEDFFTGQPSLLVANLTGATK